MLTTWVRPREEVSDDVIFLESEHHQRQCPGCFEEDATHYAKRLTVVRWSQKQQTVVICTVDEWLDGDEHERSSLVLFASAEIGKSKLAHLIAQELTIGKGMDRYTFTKSVDGLGILTYSGDLRKSGCICLMDIKFEAARGKVLGVEDFKAIWDVMEGGVIKDTRYKPANMPAGVPRVMGFQGSPEDAGIWFREHDQSNLGSFLDAVQPRKLANGRPETTSAYKERLNLLVSGFTSHEQAILRRVSIGFPTSSLVTDDFVRRLEGDSASAAATHKSRRAAYWAARRDRE